MAKNFLKQIEAIKKDIKGTIATKVEEILKGKEDTHYIEIEGILTDESDLCCTHINTIEIDNEAKIILTDNDYQQYRLTDDYPSLECFAYIADLLTNDEFELVEMEEY